MEGVRVQPSVCRPVYEDSGIECMERTHPSDAEHSEYDGPNREYWGS